MRACTSCGDVFSTWEATVWHCAGCEAWINLKNNAVRLQAENNLALAFYRPEALVSFASDGAPSPALASFNWKPVALVGHEEVARVGLGGGAAWRSTS